MPSFEAVEKGNDQTSGNEQGQRLAVENQAGAANERLSKPVVFANDTTMVFAPIPGYDQPSNRSYSAVAKEIATGALDEITNHPGRVAGKVAMGVAVGVGAALVAPEVAVGAAIVGIGVASYEVYQNARDWVNSANTVAAPKDRSAQELQSAKERLQGIGRGATDIIAGGAGGAAGAIGAGVIKNAVVRGASEMFDATVGKVMFGALGKDVPVTVIPAVSGASRAGAALAADQVEQKITR